MAAERLNHPEPGQGGEGNGPSVSFDPGAPHHAQPKLRKVRLFPMPMQDQNGKQVVILGIADAQQISPKIVGTAPAFQQVLGLFDGSRTLEQIATEVGHGLTAEMLKNLVAQLDDAGLLVGPRFDAMLAEARRKFDESDTLPPGTTAQFADALVIQAVGEDATEEQKAEMGPERLATAFDEWIDAALKPVADPAFDELPAGIIAPHIDYARGWMNYASVYGRLRTVPRPDRVIVLGTNHFGRSSGICACDKGFESPLGACHVDGEFLDVLKGKLGASGAQTMLSERYDHENEHSIELHIPWIQHIFGKDDAGAFVKVVGILVHDPVPNNGESYDGKGLGLDPFVEALKGAIEAAPGRTLVISSADLSHAGPAFGDQQKLVGEEPEVEQFRQQVAQHDSEMLGLLREAKTAELIGSMAWQQNPTRWCSVGNLVAGVRAVGAESVDILNYAAAIDPQGATMVSSAAGVMR